MRTVCDIRTASIGIRLPRRLLIIDIGLHYWEEVDIVVKGANYGYPEREGNEQLFVDDAGKTGSLKTPPVAFPDRDLLQVDGIERAGRPHLSGRRLQPSGRRLDRQRLRVPRQADAARCAENLFSMT